MKRQLPQAQLRGRAFGKRAKARLSLFVVESGVVGEQNRRGNDHPDDDEDNEQNLIAWHHDSPYMFKSHTEKLTSEPPNRREISSSEFPSEVYNNCAKAKRIFV